MPNIVVIVFDDPDEAGQVREAIRSIEHEGKISLDDSAVVVKDADGEVHVKGQTDRGVKVGAAGGGALGLLIGGIMFPVAGLALGALAGAALGKLAETGVDKKFVREIEEALEPNSSALFVITREGDPDVALAALRPYKGKVYHSSLDPEAEAELRRILDQEM